IRMVCAGAKPILRLASCCRVEVVKGACGLRRAGLASTVDTEKLAASIAFLKSSASAPVPMSSRWIFLPSAPTRRASNASPRGVVRVATSDQYSRGTNFSISSSRSQTSRSATDCTLPAERAPGNLRQHRREREADQIIQCAPRHIGIDQRAVDLARILHRVRHRLFGDGVEYH